MTDYQEWIFNEYILSISPFTSSTAWKELMGSILAGTAGIAFGGVILAWLNSFGLDIFVPVIKVEYTNFKTNTFLPSFYNPVTA